MTFKSTIETLSEVSLETQTLSLDELSGVSGGVMIEGDGSHGVPKHQPGAVPDISQYGTIAGAGL
jgi:hypothetical protein